MNYDVTIGIPFYRSVDTIDQTLESALSQTYESIEFLLIDDAGGDGSSVKVQDIIQHHLHRKDVRIISHEHNMGVAMSRNEIVDEAKGEFIYFLDSDDVIDENAISLLMKHARKYDAEIVFGSYEKIDLDGRKTLFQYPYKVFTKSDQLAAFAYRKYGGIQASACNYLVKTSVLRENHHHFIDTNYWEDLVFTFDLVTFITRAVLLPDITYSYLCRENSLSHYQQRKNISKEEIMKNVHAIEHLKKTSSILYNKVYFSNRCSNIVMTDFYIVCNILKRRKYIMPSISNKEIKVFMHHPATWSRICHFQQSRCGNMVLYMIGKLPSTLCVATIWILGKLKKLI